MRTVLVNGLLARRDSVFTADISFENGSITEIGSHLPRDNAQIISAANCVVMPGGVDVHTHVSLTVRDAAGMEHSVSDGFYDATRAAALGGTTCIVEHPSFGPKGCTLAHQVEDCKQRAQGQAVVDYGIHAVLQHMNKAIQEEIPALAAYGCPTAKAYLTYDGRLDDTALLTALESLHGSGLLMVHAENHEMIQALQKRLQDSAPADPRSYPKSRPDHAEAEAVYRVLCLAEAVGAPVYFVHISCAESLQLIHHARQRGQTVYAETCPQYLLLDESCFSRSNGLEYVMAPPPRRIRDQHALWRALQNREIDCIATDHCSFTSAQKQQLGSQNVFHSLSGISGIETRIPLLYSEGVLRGRLTIPHFVDLVSSRPAQIMGLRRKGRLEPGADADILLLDPAAERILSVETLHQKTDFCPYEGMRIRGWPRHVWLRGQQIVADGSFIGDNSGEFIAREL